MSEEVDLWEEAAGHPGNWMVRAFYGHRVSSEVTTVQGCKLAGDY